VQTGELLVTQFFALDGFKSPVARYWEVSLLWLKARRWIKNAHESIKRRLTRLSVVEDAKRLFIYCVLTACFGGFAQLESFAVFNFQRSQ
jgi:hypothetical protein